MVVQVLLLAMRSVAAQTWVEKLIPASSILVHLKVSLSTLEQSPGHLAAYVKMGPMWLSGHGDHRKSMVPPASTGTDIGAGSAAM